MKILRAIEIEGETYTSEQIQQMSFDEVKMLISFVSAEKELLFIKKIRESCYRTESYIDNLISKL